MRAAPNGAAIPGPVGMSAAPELRAPFPYFGGKRWVAPIVWERLGSVNSYVEPFAGSLAVLLARPHAPKIETVNDKSRFIANFWRAVRWAPEAVAEWADWPVNEADLEARHYWLVTEGAARLARVLGDPAGYDAQVAGWWLWGICSWIGAGWCDGDGPWRWDGERWVNGNAGRGVKRQRPHLGNAGQGVNRKLPHLGAGQGVDRKRPHLGNAGRGVNRKRPHLSDAGRGVLIREWMAALAERLRDVRVCCGDWRRVCGPSPTTQHGLTGVFLDPPYGASDRAELYEQESFTVAAEARAWAIEAGRDPLMRIAFCGYDGEFAEPWPEGWTEWRWKSRGGYGWQGNGAGRANVERERIWFSPHCLAPETARAKAQLPLFLEATE